MAVDIWVAPRTHVSNVLIFSGRGIRITGPSSHDLSHGRRDNGNGPLCAKHRRYCMTAMLHCVCSGQGLKLTASCQKVSRPHSPHVRLPSFHANVATLGYALPIHTLKLQKPVIVIDNYDSFTYNLVQYLGSLGCPLEVFRNDEITIEELKMKEPSGILISPGPGTPQDSGISLETVLQLGPDVPLFGVCMGLQCMGEAFGGKIVRSPLGVMHGKKSLVYYDEHGEDGLLAGLPNPFVAGRYHSLVIDKESFPTGELEITAWTEDGLIMGVRHKRYRHIQGVQFHPESIITEYGMKIIENFLELLAQKSVI
ncbi:hypothetical protein KP509_13G045800 [Ceratopteris richardii]|uniref:anthranilate synthase n=1 Tax=Ceratopteris richardii TaxID=49495 RepID=A0A8T2TFA3_CERRI|nr:hypothetical protein KP509_13G045800 [Ceratopteris richardii]